MSGEVLVRLVLGMGLVTFGILEMLFQRGRWSWGIKSEETLRRLRARPFTSAGGPAAILCGVAVLAGAWIP